MQHLLSAKDRKLFEDALNNVPGASTTHTARYLDVVNKILVEDKERTEYRRELEFADAIGLSHGSELEKARRFVQRFIEMKLASGEKAAGEEKVSGKKEEGTGAAVGKKGLK